MKREYSIAISADVYENVRLAGDSDIQFQSVLRGDSNIITTGEGSNIQDGTIIHVDEGAPTTVGKYIMVSHQYILHGCKIGDDTLIGMGSMILNNAIIGEDSPIDVDFLVTEGKIIPPDVLAFGRPAEVIRLLAAAKIASNHTNALYYIQRAEEFRQ